MSKKSSVWNLNYLGCCLYLDQHLRKGHRRPSRPFFLSIIEISPLCFLLPAFSPGWVSFLASRVPAFVPHVSSQRYSKLWQCWHNCVRELCPAASAATYLPAAVEDKLACLRDVTQGVFQPPAVICLIQTKLWQIHKHKQQQMANLVGAIKNLTPSSPSVTSKNLKLH